MGAEDRMQWFQWCPKFNCFDLDLSVPTQSQSVNGWSYMKKLLADSLAGRGKEVRNQW